MNKIRILWVEDRQVLMRNLSIEVQKHFEISFADSVDEALYFIDTYGPFDAYIIDILLPLTFSAPSEGYKTADIKFTDIENQYKGLYLVNYIKKTNIRPMIFITIVVDDAEKDQIYRYLLENGINEYIYIPKEDIFIEGTISEINKFLNENTFGR